MTRAEINAAWRAEYPVLMERIATAAAMKCETLSDCNARRVAIRRATARIHRLASAFPSDLFDDDGVTEQTPSNSDRDLWGDGIEELVAKYAKDNGNG